MSQFLFDFGPGRAGILLGLALAVGLWTTYSGLPHHRRPTLETRLAPYLTDSARPTRLRQRQGTRHPVGVVAVLGRPIVADLGRHIERLLGGSASVRKRLQRAGLAPDVERFRAEQVLTGAAGSVLGLLLGFALVAARGAPPIMFLTSILLGLAGGVIGWDQWLSHRAQSREALMLTEFPTVAELLALAVGAGEGAVGALERVCRLSQGELATELSRCLADARAGANLPTALQGLADRTGLMSLSRFVDGIVVAVERGTPLADVLRAQAQDVREEGRRDLMEKGGRKEIAMMVPVVFLVLPITVLFAVYPGFDFLSFQM